MEAHKGCTSSKASPPNQAIQQVRLSVSTGNLPWTLSKVGEGPPHHAKLGDRECVPGGAALEQSLGGRRDEGGNSGRPGGRNMRKHSREGGTGTEKPWDRGDRDHWVSQEREGQVGGEWGGGF